MNLTKQEWKGWIVNGCGGVLLFLTAGYFAVIDVLTYFNGRLLLNYYSKMSADNDFGIFLTLILILLSLEGLILFIQQVRHAYKKQHKG